MVAEVNVLVELWALGQLNITLVVFKDSSASSLASSPRSRMNNLIHTASWVAPEQRHVLFVCRQERLAALLLGDS